MNSSQEVNKYLFVDATDLGQGSGEKKSKFGKMNKKKSNYSVGSGEVQRHNHLEGLKGEELKGVRI